MALAMLVLALLAGCRGQASGQYFEGVALGTGYHITLDADLDIGERELLQAAIQGELGSLENGLLSLRPLLAAPLPLVNQEALPSLARAGRLLQLEHWAHAVDRLDAVLAEFGMSNAMIELGGMVRTRGMAGRQLWRLAIDKAHLPGEQHAVLSLQDAALVTVATATVRGDMAGRGGRRPRLLEVSVVAPEARSALHQALRIAKGEAWARDERMARQVVMTRQGIDIHYGEAFVALLLEER
ncbi:FAD:protein FMN transferase [Halomonas urumqiensis]|uniref:FAD:protein FMN transferase n=1 Tax=Halomonas urumqiensis TaxID=1684789 RepID=UPI0015E12F8E|nr:FAD:protein FMN transferase [Halomonas urumqiensis]